MFIGKVGVCDCSECRGVRKHWKVVHLYMLSIFRFGTMFQIHYFCILNLMALSVFRAEVYLGAGDQPKLIGVLGVLLRWSSPYG